MSERNVLICAARGCDGCTVCEPAKWLDYYQEENSKLREALNKIAALGFDSTEHAPRIARKALTKK